MLSVGWAGPLQLRLHVPNHHLKMETCSSGFKTRQKVAREAAPLLSHARGAGFGCLFCYWAENNASLIGEEFDLKGRFTVHTVIGPTSPLPNAPDTRISFIPLTFYYLLNLSYYLESAKSC